MIEFPLEDFCAFKSGREGEWLILCFKRNHVFEAWLNHEDIGQMTFMFGCMEEDVESMKNFVSIVQMNLSRELEIYEEEFKDDLSYLRD